MAGASTACATASGVVQNFPKIPARWRRRRRQAEASGRKVFFFEKKKQKTFGHSASAFPG
jgi:hypothetical protein